MEKRHKDILRRLRTFLVEQVDLENGLYSEMREHNLLRKREEYSVQHNRDLFQQVEKLIDLIERKGPNAFRILIECLEANGQDDVAHKLREADAAEHDHRQVVVKQDIHHGQGLDSVNECQPMESEDESICLSDSPHHIQVAQCTQEFYNANQHKAYPMFKRTRGLVCIINVKGHGSNMRMGTDIDRDKLQELWTKLYFQVIVYNDADGLTARGMLQKVEDFAARPDHVESQCVVLCVLSHGTNGNVLGTDRQPCAIDRLLDCFNNARCPQLRGIPKLFFFQACRGVAIDRGLIMPDFDTQVVPKSDHIVPRTGDYLISYPTQAGYKCWREPDKGSWYMAALVQVFAKYAASRSICAMLHIVKKLLDEKVVELDIPVIGGAMQGAEFVSNLTMEELYFFPGVTRDKCLAGKLPQDSTQQDSLYSYQQLDEELGIGVTRTPCEVPRAT